MPGLTQNKEAIPQHFHAIFNQPLVPAWGDPLCVNMMVCHLALTQPHEDLNANRIILCLRESFLTKRIEVVTRCMNATITLRALRGEQDELEHTKQAFKNLTLPEN